ncbi:hypothetical protein AAFF_G00269120 [Aldrovandia affinis]|uniref:Ankyrin repeat domain-containing protein SOWAHC-like n=1 Tax=Aldrovandia affinis TaxID=143900 RepID=A0AAD7STG8_9TELE|nr:hypothetical protein AAFF_G00269120 [Aldrovandia affinis]
MLIIGANCQGQRAAASQPGDLEDTGRPKGVASGDARSSQEDGGDSTCADLQSLKSDCISLASEAASSGKSDGEQECQEDDVRSVTTSSVMSLFQRLQLDPLEREWLRLAALGDTPALRRLLRQDPTLASKKTALHWAAKQGCLEMAEMMARAGVDVNVKSGYTALHLAALHGHPHIIQLLLNTYNAKANIRDYHGKMAAHYWSGSADVFSTPGSQSPLLSEHGGGFGRVEAAARVPVLTDRAVPAGGKRSRGGCAQRYAHLPSLLPSSLSLSLSRSRSQGHLNLQLTTAPEQPPTYRARASSPS